MKTKTEGQHGLSSNNSQSKFFILLKLSGEKTEDRLEEK